MNTLNMLDHLKNNGQRIASRIRRGILIKRECITILIIIVVLFSLVAYNSSVSVDGPDSTGMSQYATATPGVTPSPENSTEIQSTPNVSHAPDKVDEILSNMTLYEKICQVLIVSPESLTGVSKVTAAGEITKQALAQMPVGGILYSKQNFVSKSQVKQMLTGIQEYSKLPLFLSCDEEGGRVNRLMNTVGTTYIGPMLSYKDKGVDVANLLPMFLMI